MKIALVSILIIAAALSAAPSTYNILKLPAGSAPVPEGTLGEWNEAYFIDSLRNNDNCFSENNPPWTPANIQYKVYAAWDSNRVYFAVKMVSDQTIIGATTQCMKDNIKINPGGKGEAFYITIDGGELFNGSCPFTNTMVGGVDPAGNGNLPSYEFSLTLNSLDPNGLGMVKLSVGTEDEDDIYCGLETYCGIGVEYTGPKNFSSSQWDNISYYPTFNFSPATGPALGSHWIPGTNIPPVFISRPDTSANENALYTYAASASDPDAGDHLTYALTVRPFGMAINNSSGLITWTPVTAQIGDTNVTVVAVDDSGAVVTQNYRLHVSAAVPNNPPVLTVVRPMADTTIFERDSVTFKVSAADPDNGDVVTFTWFVNGQAVVTSDSFVIRTGLSSAGVDSIKVVATDGKTQVPHEWVLTILNRSVAPVITHPLNGHNMDPDSLFSWTPADPDLKGKIRYTLQFSSSAAFSDTLAGQDTLLTDTLRARDINGKSNLPASALVFWRVQAWDTTGYVTPYTSGANYFVWDGLIAVEKSGKGRPSVFALDGARPNPFNPTTRINFAVPGTTRSMDLRRVSLDLYNVNGGHVRTLADGLMKPGYYSVFFDGQSDKGRALASGVYYCKMRAGGFEATKVILMMK